MSFLKNRYNLLRESFFKSRIGFYFLNLRWNLKFWLLSEKVYKDFSYLVNDGIDENSIYDVGVKIKFKKKTITSKRFIGFLYEGRIYLDNPGIQNVKKEIKDSWIKKRLLK